MTPNDLMRCRECGQMFEPTYPDDPNNICEECEEAIAEAEEQEQEDNDQL